jgi:hypothetical protein
MITSKEIAEKIHMFYNLLYHLDDYIKNKKERKGQLHLSKSLRLVLREVISSKNNLKYFLNKEEIDSHLSKYISNLKIKKEDEKFKTMKSITPFSFNQKNLNTISYFYNTKNEVYVINYLVIEKIFSIIRFCFIETMKKRKKEFIKEIENKNKTNFSLYKIDEINSNDLIKNKILKKNNTFLKNSIDSKIEEDQDTLSSNKGINMIKPNRAFREKKMNETDQKNRVTINISSMINNNCNYLNIFSHKYEINNDFIKNNKNLLRNLRWQVKIINDRVKLSQIKGKQKIYLNNRIIKQESSFPIIKTHKNVINKSMEKIGKNKNDESTLVSENKIDAKNIITNIIKSRKLNLPESTKSINKYDKHNRSGININYDYRRVLPLFRLSKFNK